MILLKNIISSFFKKINPLFSDARLRILMYHKVSTNTSDYLTVTAQQLESHLQYIQQAGYQIINIKDLLLYLEKKRPLPPKPLLLTFDDGYLNNLLVAYPILQKYQAKASIFLPTVFIGKTSSWDANAETLMNLEQLKSMNTQLVEFALHTHNHLNFNSLNLVEIENELQLCIQFFEENQLNCVPALAYPFGGRPKNRAILNGMYQILTKLGIKLAFRIGNRFNDLPLKNPYEIQRLDIRGTDSMEVFKQKLKVGKWI